MTDKIRDIAVRFNEIDLSSSDTIDVSELRAIRSDLVNYLFFDKKKTRIDDLELKVSFLLKAIEEISNRAKPDSTYFGEAMG